jgi:hypothetical protein
LRRASNIISTIAMRSFVKNPDRDQTGLNKKRRESTSTEWDIGINLKVGEEQAMAMALQGYASAQCTKADSIIKYLLISGIEFTDQTRETGNTTKGNPHLHVALITTEAINKAQALSLLRAVKMGPKEYGRVRPKAWSYYGWRLHHIKVNTKVDPTHRILYEFGILPEDVWTNPLILSVNKVVNNHGDCKDKEDWMQLRNGLRLGMTETKKKEIATFKELERTKRLYEQQLMLMEDVWEQSRQAEERQEEEKELKNLWDTEEDKRRKNARIGYFVNKARKRRRKF